MKPTHQEYNINGKKTTLMQNKYITSLYIIYTCILCIKKNINQYDI